MFKKILYLVLLFPVHAFSQFYYKDLVGLQQTVDLQQTYKFQKVRKIVLTSFNPDDTPVPNFICFQELSPSYNMIKTYTQSVASMQSVVVSQFNGKMQLIRSSDSSNASLAVTTYTYNEQGLLTLVEINTKSYAYNQTEKEKHVWQYDSNNNVEQMLRVTNNGDTLMVKFKCDEKGLPIEEKWYNKNGISTNLYYYYYENNKLTDIVKFNERVQKLLPEYLFEYAESAKPAQMITVQTGTSNYFIWKYRYNDKGLKDQERCYNKQKQLQGYVSYSYQ